jgi:peptidyl-prolyl cis-trans isomerase C
MKKQLLLAATITGMLAFGAQGALAQNVAIVNGKAVPKTRLDSLALQVVKSGRAVTPEMEGQLREEVIAREVFMQEADKLGLAASDDVKVQMELARQTILIRELFADYQKKNPVTEAEMKAEYDKFAAANGGKEYKARHILVEKESEAKEIIASLKKAASLTKSPRRNPRTPDPAPRAATSTGPTLRAMCLTSPKRWSS